nr:MAG: ORF1 [TTV-like mini virus]
MPWWWRNYRYRWRPRRRPLWRRRPRRAFQRRLWRRRHYRVRRKKLKFIRPKQWQPYCVRKLKIRGYYPLFMTTNERTTNNLNIYLESTAPHDVPGGGGFQIANWSLETLYKEHLVLRNWWTTSNDNLPLVRYSGCKIKLYRSTSADYMFYYNNNYPMKSNLTMYQSCNPAIMMLNKHTIYMPCKQHNRNKKPYKTVRIRPPSLMESKWYFQKDIAQIPLLQTISTACSLDRMFTSSQAISSTVGFVSLDTRGFKNHNFTRLPTTGYKPNTNELLFGTRNGGEIQKLKISNIIFLGNTDDLEQGIEIGQITINASIVQTTDSEITKKLKTCRQEKKWWGNPFKSSYFYYDQRIITTNKTWDDIIENYKTDTELGTGWTEKTQKTIQCRYNPFYDKGIHNQIYLLKIDNQSSPQNWEPPAEPQLIAEDLPLWALTFGYLDAQKKLAIYNNIETTCVFVIHSPYIKGSDFQYYVPLDKDFLDGRSPYRPDEGHIIPTDQLYWHPKVAFQYQSINMLGSCGPASIKLPKQVSAEAHMQYCFYFKVGGNPPPMSTVIDPDNQPKFPTPGNLLKTTSLQNPTQPFEYVLSNFDERRGQLTKTASKRISKHQETETCILPITETSLLRPQSPETTTSETSDSEKEETTLQDQILRHRREQRQLRHRINKLLHKLANLE